MAEHHHHNILSTKMNACMYRDCFSTVSSCDRTPFTTCCIQLTYLGDQIRADGRATPEGISIEGSVSGLERKHQRNVQSIQLQHCGQGAARPSIPGSKWVYGQCKDD